MPRAIETAEIIAPPLGGLAVPQDEGLCERHPGEADGMSYDDARAQYGDERRRGRSLLAFSPGGETWTDFHARVDTTLRRLAAEHQDHTVVVACHGGSSIVALRGLLDLPMVGGFEVYTQNTSLTSS